ncbi:polysaccharide biosynthesis C-terminal domain-containing protein [Alkalibacterium sp. 20]|uniref:polysaccharide biosynthesis C-terminal domain-containing protein n=1 Tax=Alkalibacterium sp. 20 TaxID=1798803 RepID=UPI003528A353
MYKESKKYTLATAVLNFILSLILVNIFSINGLLLSTVITNYFIMDLGNYKLVYNQIFNKSIRVPLRDFGLIFINLFLTLAVIYLVNRLMIANFSLSWLIFMVKALLLTIISFVITFGFLVKFDDSFMRLLSRIFSNI